MPLVTATVSPEPITLDLLAAAVDSPHHGAITTFVGQVRDHDETAAGEVVRLEYSAHPEAGPLLGRVVDEALATADPDGAARVAVAHRTGSLEVGEIALLVCVGSAHRDLAFVVCREVVEAVKRDLPVWKKQHESDGRHAWSGLDPVDGAARQPGEPGTDP